MSVFVPCTVERYSIYYVTGDPKIYLYGKYYYGNDHQDHLYAELTFYPDDRSELLEDFYEERDGHTYMFLSYRISDFQNVLDILRNESPLRFQFIDSGDPEKTFNGIFTAELEPPGLGDEHPVFTNTHNPGTPR